MSGLDQLQYLSWLLYLFVFVAVLVRTIRRPSPAHVDMTLFFGGVAVLIVFTILLTRREATALDPFKWGGVVVAIAVFGGLLWAILQTPALSMAAPQIEALTVKRIGEVLMTDFVWPLQCVGLVLTAALIGALILVMEERR